MALPAEAPSFDDERAAAFGERTLGLVNGGFLAIGLSIGHQTGLFDTLATLPLATSEEIANAARLDERYVREWLAAMTTGRIVDYDATSGRYSLPPEHAASLTRAAGGGNIAHLAQLLTLLAPVEPRVIEAFRAGGGVGYEHYPGFARLMREDSALVFDVALLDKIVPLVPGLHEKLDGGASLADVGCGAGHAVNLLGRAYPKSQFTGYDISQEALALARVEAADWGLANVDFAERDAANLDVAERFDAITAFDAIHDQAWPRKVLSAIHRALKPDGVFLMVDIAASSRLEENLEDPTAPFGYTVSYLHCMTVSLAQGGEGLGTMWGREKAVELLHEAGFDTIEVKQIEVDLFNNYFICRK
jgi:SAM-dependent methyltransferase